MLIPIKDIFLYKGTIIRMIVESTSKEIVDFIAVGGLTKEELLLIEDFIMHYDLIKQYQDLDLLEWGDNFKL